MAIYDGVFNLLTVSEAPKFSLFLLIESIAICFALYYFVFRRNKKRLPALTEKEKEELIAKWQPEPLVPDTPPDHFALHPKFIDGKMTKHVSIEGKDYLNLATSNFLGFVGVDRIEKRAKETIFKYGVGSCGPRGFYGTVDVHLDLEKQIAEFLHCEESVLYSYGFATIASAIPAYSKRGDVVFADKCVNFAIQKGLQASRSRIEWFEHNDVTDLERLLLEQAEKDRKNPKIAAKTRRFMVVEGLYAKTGQLCPLPDLIALKWKYKVRIFIDESLSFGVLGKTGRGVTEHYGIDVEEVDMIMGSLEHSIASTGGFCAGRSFVIGHQRLSGTGYCFSASLPPLLATAASEALKIMDEEPERFERLRYFSKILFQRLREICKESDFYVQGSELSPVQHVHCKLDDCSAKEKMLDSLVDKLFGKQIMVTRARYLKDEEAFTVQPSVKVVVQSELTNEELEHFFESFKSVIDEIKEESAERHR